MNVINFEKLQFEFPPTTEQQKILQTVIDDPQQNIAVSSVAGSGKTTLLHMIDKCLKVYRPTASRLYLTFSKALANDLEKRVGKSAKTTHSYCLAILKSYCKANGIRNNLGRWNGRKCHSPVDEDLMFKLAYPKIKASYGLDPNSFTIPTSLKPKINLTVKSVLAMIDMIRNSLIGLDEMSVEQHVSSTNLIYDDKDFVLATETVKESIKWFLKKGQTDYLGMLYLPLVLRDKLESYIPQIDFLAVDEVNDSNKLLRSVYQLVSQDNTQVVLVGDPQQAIHAWNGTESNCFEISQVLFNCKVETYPTSFRLNRSTVNYLRRSTLDTRVKVFSEAVEGEINPDMSYYAFTQQVENGDMVLCPYNRGDRVEYTLDKVAIDLLSDGKSVVLLGSDYLTHIDVVKKFIDREIEDKKLPKAFNLIDVAKQSIRTAIDHLEKSGGKNKERRIDGLRSSLETFLLYANYYSKKFDITEYKPHDFYDHVANIYKVRGSHIKLSSIHRSKGLESNKVWLLHGEEVEYRITDEALSPISRNEARNLFYVALTRHKQTLNLVEYDLPDIIASE